MTEKLYRVTLTVDLVFAARDGNEQYQAYKAVKEYVSQIEHFGAVFQVKSDKDLPPDVCVDDEVCNGDKTVSEYLTPITEMENSL